MSTFLGILIAAAVVGCIYLRHRWKINKINRDITAILNKPGYDCDGQKKAIVDYAKKSNLMLYGQIHQSPNETAVFINKERHSFEKKNDCWYPIAS